MSQAFAPDGTRRYKKGNSTVRPMLCACGPSELFKSVHMIYMHSCVCDEIVSLLLCACHDLYLGLPVEPAAVCCIEQRTLANS